MMKSLLGMRGGSGGTTHIYHIVRQIPALFIGNDGEEPAGKTTNHSLL